MNLLYNTMKTMAVIPAYTFSLVSEKLSLEENDLEFKRKCRKTFEGILYNNIGKISGNQKLQNKGLKKLSELEHLPKEERSNA